MINIMSRPKPAKRAPCLLVTYAMNGVFYCKPPDIEMELLVDLIGWRYVEHKIEPRPPMTKEERYEYALDRELYDANKGV